MSRTKQLLMSIQEKLDELKKKFHLTFVITYGVY